MNSVIGLGWDIHFAQQDNLPGGGKRVIFMTDRRIGQAEAASDSRSMDYEFTLGEIRLDKKNGLEGEGKLVPAGKVSYNKKTNHIEIENYGAEPLRFSDVRVDVPKAKGK
jgi:hypothetical protein